MPELRRDPVSGRWVIVSPERANRPLPHQPARECPFCPGNESETPPEVFAIRSQKGLPNDPNWRLRVIPNRYPALTPNAAPGATARGLFRKKAGVGLHEVIIESRAHKISLTELDEEEVALAMGVYRERMALHRKWEDLEYALLFKNVGVEAGASIEHTHSQIIGTPILPGVIEQEARNIRRRWRERRECVFCEMVRLEAADGRRMVLATDPFVAFCPYASRFPLEVWIVPTAHGPDFDLLADSLVGPLGFFLRDVLVRIEREMGAPRYNVLFHTAPFRRGGDDSFHWHIEVMPRLGQAAGFEWGSGLHVNPLTPEEAAARLRSDGGKPLAPG